MVKHFFYEKKGTKPKMVKHLKEVTCTLKSQVKKIQEKDH